MVDVISIGAATVDIFVKSKDFVVNNNLLSLAYSSKSEITQSLICSGGGATNSSVSFSRLGLKSACISLLGQDPLSQYVLNDLKTDSVDSQLLSRLSSETTDFSVVLVAPDGGRSILTQRGHTSLEEKHLDWSALQTAKWFYISSLEGNLDLLEKLIGFALENNIKISLNPGNRELQKLNNLIPLLSHIDFLLLNRAESELLTGFDPESEKFASKLNSFGAKITAVTNGREGAHIFTKDNTFYSPIINTDPVDETGAGDSFGSAFVAALIHGLLPQDALHWAIKNSASVVSYLGAKPGLLTLNQIRNAS